MPFPRIIPHSDGAGVIECVGDQVASSRLGERVWCFGAQSYRPFGTAAEYTVVPAAQTVPLSDTTTYEQGACLGIPGITGHRAIDVAGSLGGTASSWFRVGRALLASAPPAWPATREHSSSLLSDLNMTNRSRSAPVLIMCL
jgi:NADPH:quinone reductase-like Zn-dependent oxidoreductase